MTKVPPEELAALVKIFDASEWKELHLTLRDTELFLSKDPNAVAPGRAAPVAFTATPPVPPAAPVVSVPPPARPAAGAGVAVPAGWAAIRAPNLGTFYRAPKPGAPPYVEIGQAITPEAEVCLIEVMKLFTPVRAGMTGTVRQVCVADGELVEFDQVLFLVEPDA